MGGSGFTAPPPTQWDQALALLSEIVTCFDHTDDKTMARMMTKLTAQEPPVWRHTVERVLLHAFVATIETLWHSGWQPADLLRVAARRLKPPHDRLRAP